MAGEHRGAPGAVKPAAQTAGNDAPAAARRSPAQNYGKLPLAFEANQGQTDSRVKFFSRGKGYALFLSGDEAVLSLRAGSQQSKVKGQKVKAEDDLELLGVPSPSPAPSTQHPEPAVLRLKLAGAEAGAKVTGLDELPGKSNYFIGNDPKKWRTNVPNYGKVKYEGVYPGIDLVYYGNQRQLEYDFVVAPGADPTAIRLGIVGAGLAPSAGAQQAAPLRIDSSGDLVISTGAGVVRFHKPVVYQEESGVRSQESGGRRLAADNLQSSLGDRQSIDGRFVLLAGNRVGFEVGAYDKSKPLVIDPVLSYATFLGGTSVDAATSIAVDGSGNAYVTGVTSSYDFPTTAGPFFSGSSYDAFVTKLDPTGSTALYSTYLGGTGDDFGTSIAVDGNGNAYIAGETTSTDFPVTVGALQTACRVATTCDDAFVTKLDPSGATLVYSTYFGGTGAEGATRLVLDHSNNVYIAGVTDSTDILPTPPTSFTPYQATNHGGKDAFLAQLNTTGTTLLYFTYLGGTGNDHALDLVVKPGSTTAFLTGKTQSTNFPVWPSPGAYQTALKGPEDAFVTAIDISQPPASALVYSTYLGGTGDDTAAGIALDSFGNVYVAGTTDSTDFPTVSATQTTYGGGLDDIFLAELDPTQSGSAALLFSTYLGGSLDDQGSRVVVDASSNIFVAGFTDSVDFPTANPIQADNAGGYDVTLTEFSDGVLFFSTYLGGANDEVNVPVPNIGAVGGIALDNAGNLYATSYTGSSDFPVTPGSYQTTAPGNGDAFVVKIDLSPAADTSAVVLTPPRLSFVNLNLGVASSPQTITLHNVGSAQLDFSAFNIQPGANTVSGEFTESNGCNLLIAGGAFCTFTVILTPQTVGPKSATLQISDNAGGSPQTQNAALTGNPPGASVFPTNINFGSVIEGAQSAFVEVTVTSTGAAPLTISNIATTGDFGVPLPNTSGLPACQLLLGSPLAISSSCRIPVIFVPTATGTRRGTLTITDDDPGIQQIVTLTGTGTAKPAISLSAASVNFPGNPVGVNCPTKGVTITNNGPSVLTISSLSGISAPLTIDASSTTCAVNTPVPSGQNCVINFKFSPTAVGTVNQTLTITSNAQGSPHSVAVSGTGTPACALVAKAHTATVLRGTDAQDFAVEDAKPSCSPVSINLSCSAANPVACALAPAVIAPGGASTLKVTNLKALGADSVSVRVDSTSEFRAAWETMTVFVSDFAFSHAPDSASVAAGETASYSLAIRPVNGLAGTVSLGCSGVPRGASCAVTPSKITLDGASVAQVKVNVSTTARARALPQVHLPSDGARRTLPGLLMALLGLAVAAVSHRRKMSPAGTPALQRLLLAATLGALLLWASCGGGGGMNFNAGGTPAGTYTLSITGTYANPSGSTPGSLVNSTTVTLLVK